MLLNKELKREVEELFNTKFNDEDEITNAENIINKLLDLNQSKDEEIEYLINVIEERGD